MPGWNHYPVSERLSQHFGVPALVDNDVNIMAVGEHWVNWRDEAFLLFVKIGTGIGSGIVAGGHVHRGADGAAGDIGHIHVRDHDDVVCRCGNVGCLEAVAGGRALANRLHELGLPTRSSRDVVHQVLAGQHDAVRLVRQAGLEIGGVLAACVNILNPAVIVIGGDIAAAGEPLLAGIREVVYRRSLPLATGRLRIVPAGLGDSAGIVGAAVMVLEAILAPAAIDATLAPAPAPADGDFLADLSCKFASNQGIGKGSAEHAGEETLMLMRTDPFRDLDRLTQQVFGTATRPAAMPIDAYRRGEEFVVELDLPGVEPDSIDLTVEKNVLTVHAERRARRERGRGAARRRAPPRHLQPPALPRRVASTPTPSRPTTSTACSPCVCRWPRRPSRAGWRSRPASAPARRSMPTPRSSLTPRPDPRPAMPLPIDDEHAPIYTVGQVAGMLGVQPAFVRRLDTEEVVQPARSDGGQRRYTRAEIATVQQVARMADDGMSLPGIRRILVLEAEVVRLHQEIARLKATGRRRVRRHPDGRSSVDRSG